jgi:hypothetical protein
MRRRRRLQKRAKPASFVHRKPSKKNRCRLVCVFEKEECAVPQTWERLSLE